MFAACKHTYADTLHAQYTYKEPIYFLIFFFFFFFFLLFDRHVVENVYLCGSGGRQMFMWVLKRKKNGEGVRHMFREPESHTQSSIYSTFVVK